MNHLGPTQVPSIPSNLLYNSTDFNLPPNHVQDPLVKRRLSPEEWTDEKHSMYLKSMEASFVRQLHNSKQVLGWCSPQATFSYSTLTTPTQSKDPGGGCWKRIKFERGNGQISRGNRRRVAGAIAEENLMSTTTSVVCGFGQRKQIPSASPHLHLCHHDMFLSDIEMTDQNFVDEEVECDKKNVKRLKSLISDTFIHQC